MTKTINDNKQKTPDSLNEFIKKAGLILFLAHKKYAISRYLRDCKDWAVQGNDFLFLTMHIYFQYSVIDTWKLVSSSSNDKYRLKRLTKTYRSEVGSERAQKIETILSELKSDIDVLQKLRHEFYAHNEMKDKASVPFYMTHLSSLENVINGCTKIYGMFGGLDFNVDEITEIESVIKLIKENDPHVQYMNEHHRIEI